MKTVAEIVAAHSPKDHTESIRAALKKLGNKVEYEIEFARLAEVGSQKIGAYRAQFADYVVRVKTAGGKGRFVWCGTPATAKTLRDSLI